MVIIHLFCQSIHIRIPGQLNQLLQTCQLTIHSKWRMQEPVYNCFRKQTCTYVWYQVWQVFCLSMPRKFRFGCNCNWNWISKISQPNSLLQFWEAEDTLFKQLLNDFQILHHAQQKQWKSESTPKENVSWESNMLTLLASLISTSFSLMLFSAIIASSWQVLNLRQSLTWNAHNKASKVFLKSSSS